MEIDQELALEVTRVREVIIPFYEGKTEGIARFAVNMATADIATAETAIQDGDAEAKRLAHNGLLRHTGR